ncbi:uncharacterized protein LOC119092970 [Pollicipes pollicipes]|uniref:uncharacterized protein LOC119092970 n=1 Tax=Pollicipes pollicipes TaxID=41117 RepID=UPI001884FAC1|nr:uncharacterized protein LOC119092970 [Pollicipes pollicipes]
MLRSRRSGGQPADGATEPERSRPPDIPNGVLAELWEEHSDGVGSPLIDIFTDCSSQMSEEEAAATAAPDEDESAAGRRPAAAAARCELDGVLLSAGEDVIEVVDDVSGVVAEAGGVIWVVENDVGEDAGPERCPVPGLGPTAPAGGSAGVISPPSSTSPVLHRPRPASVPRRRKPAQKLTTKFAVIKSYGRAWTRERWYRSDAARCRVCRKFIARVLMPLHLRLHRTGYRGCDVCGLVMESASALYPASSLSVGDYFQIAWAIQ